MRASALGATRIATLGLGLVLALGACAGFPKATGPADAASAASEAANNAAAADGYELGKPRVYAPAEIREYQGSRLAPASAYPDLGIDGTKVVDIGSWRLEVTGLVARPLGLAYPEVLALPQAQKLVTLHCVEGWAETSLWSGPALDELLETAGPLPGATTVVFEAADGYSTSLPLTLVRDLHLILGARINGIELPAARGFPLRLVAESRYGYKWIKWLTRIRLSDDPGYRGTWETLGYSIDGEVGGARRDPLPPPTDPKVR